MKLPDRESVASAEEARDLAIEWQHWASEEDLDYLELSYYGNYFEYLALKFNLTDEFRENGII